MDVKRKISRLEARLSARFDLVTDAVPVGPLRVQFSRVRDPQKVLNDLCDKIDAFERLTGKRVDGDELGLPYWAELWDSSIGVGQWLIRESVKWRATSDELHSSSLVARRSVLDLGCGLGLCGTVAGLLGADVLFADLEADCLLFSLLNGLRYNPRSVAKRVNWQTDDLGRRFDLIIGSDVLYDRSQWVYLHPFFKNHIAPGGTILLGEPGRITGELFVPWVQEQGWHFREQHEHIPNRLTPIRLFELQSGDESMSRLVVES